MEALGMPWSDVWVTVVTAVGIYVAVVALARVFGQRCSPASPRTTSRSCSRSARWSDG